MKKLIGSVRFWFYKPKNEKTELNQIEPKSKKITKNRAKPGQTEKTKPKPSQTEKTKPNRFEPVFVIKNQTETGRFEPISVRFRFFYKKIKFWFGYFFNKNRTEPKMITLK